MEKKNNKNHIIMLAEAGIMLAIATVLSLVNIFKMPFGGSVTLFSMLPIVIFAYRHRMPEAVVLAVLNGIIQLLLGLKNFSYVDGLKSYIIVALFDYILAFGVLGFSGMFKRVKKRTAIIASGAILLSTVILFTVSLLSSGDSDMVSLLKSNWWIIAIEIGAVVIITVLALLFKDRLTLSSVIMMSGLAVTGVIRFVCHFISGVTVWSEYAADRTAVMYSLYYNLSYMIPEIITSIIMLIISANLLNFDAKILDVRLKDESKVENLTDFKAVRTQLEVLEQSFKDGKISEEVYKEKKRELLKKIPM